MAIIQSGVSGSTLMTVDPTFAAARMAPRPFDALGYYSIGAQTGAVTGLAANANFFLFRWVPAAAGSAQICLINKVSVAFVPTVAGTQGQLTFGIMRYSSYTAVGSGGTQILTTGDNGKLRSSFPTSNVNDMRISTTAALTTGTATAASTFTAAHTFLSPSLAVASFNPVTFPPSVIYEYIPGRNYPLVLAGTSAAPEGFAIQMVTAMPATVQGYFAVQVEWAESNTSATTTF